MAAQGWSQQSELGRSRGIRGDEDHLSVPEVGYAGLARQVQREEVGNEPGESANVSRLREDGLQFALGRKNAVESGKSHGSSVLERESRADYPDL